jgi:hypothetical protein
MGEWDWFWAAEVVLFTGSSHGFYISRHWGGMGRDCCGGDYFRVFDICTNVGPNLVAMYGLLGLIINGLRSERMEDGGRCEGYTKIMPVGGLG